MISYKNAFLYFSFLHQDDDLVLETPLWKLADEVDNGEGGDGRDWMSRDGPFDSTAGEGTRVQGGIASERVRDDMPLDRRAREDRSCHQGTTGPPSDGLTSRPEDSPPISD